MYDGRTGHVLMIRPIASDDHAFETMIAELEEAGLPTDDLSRSGTDFYAFGDAEAFGGVAVIGASALLRSLVVRADRRGNGYGSEMLNGLVEIAHNRGVKEVWLLTVSTKEFFERHGFETMDRSHAPDVIATTSLFRDQCPATAVLMRRRLQ